MINHERLEMCILDDDTAAAEALAAALRPLGYRPFLTSNSNEIFARNQKSPIDILLLGLNCQGTLDLRQIRTMIRALQSARVMALLPEELVSYEEMLRESGVILTMSRKLSARQMAQMISAQCELRALETQNVRLREMLDGRVTYQNLVGASAPMRALYRLIDQIARTQTPVLVTGEEGTERLEVARAIHSRGERAMAPLVVVDCAAHPDDPTGEFLMGPRGAGRYRNGPSATTSAFAQAGNGVVIIENIDRLGLPAQQRLLEFLHRPFFQDETPGTPQPLSRIVATGPGNLLAKVEAEEFLRELFYRLSILQVRVPALRERREDIPMLAQQLLREAADGNADGVKGLSFSGRAMLQMFQYNWPGNLNEMRDMIEELSRNAQGPQIEVEHLPENFRVSVEETAPGHGASVDLAMPLKEAKRQFETQYFTTLLRRTQGNMTAASRQSRVGRPYLYKKIKEYGIEPEEYR